MLNIAREIQPFQVREFRMLESDSLNPLINPNRSVVALANGEVSLSSFRAEVTFELIAVSDISSFIVALPASVEAPVCAHRHGATAKVLASADAVRIIRYLRFI